MVENSSYREKASGFLDSLDKRLKNYGQQFRNRREAAAERKREITFAVHGEKMRQTLFEIDETVEVLNLAKESGDGDLTVINRWLKELRERRYKILRMMPAAERQRDSERLRQRELEAKQQDVEAEQVVTTPPPSAWDEEPYTPSQPNPDRQVFANDLIGMGVKKEPRLIRPVNGGERVYTDGPRVRPIDDSVILRGEPTYYRGRADRITFNDPEYSAQPWWRRWSDKMRGRGVPVYRRLNPDEVILGDETVDGEIRPAPFVAERRVHSPSTTWGAVAGAVGITSLVWWGAHQADDIREHIHLGKYDKPHLEVGGARVIGPAAVLAPSIAERPGPAPVIAGTSEEDRRLAELRATANDFMNRIEGGFNSVTSAVQSEGKATRETIISQQSATRAAIAAEEAKTRQDILAAVGLLNRDNNNGQAKPGENGRTNTPPAGKAAESGPTGNLPSANQKPAESAKTPILNKDEIKPYVFRDPDQIRANSTEAKTVEVRNGRGEMVSVPIEQTSSLRGKAEYWWMSVIYDKENRKEAFNPYAADAQKQVAEAIKKYGGQERYNQEVKALMGYMQWATLKYADQNHTYFSDQVNGQNTDVLVLHTQAPRDKKLGVLIEPKGADEAKKVIMYSKLFSNPEEFKKAV